VSVSSSSSLLLSVFPVTQFRRQVKQFGGVVEAIDFSGFAPIKHSHRLNTATLEDDPKPFDKDPPLLDL
jgi:hypothetical protein